MMDLNNPEKPYHIIAKDFSDSRSEKVRIMVCQLNFDRMRSTKGVRLNFVDNDTGNRSYLHWFMDIAASQKVDLLVFPELTVPSEFVESIVDFAKTNDMYIVGGTHYKRTEKGFISVCPIITPQGIFNTEKITPSPFEQSSFNDGIDGAIPGSELIVLRGTKIGDFAVLICLDYTNDSLRSELINNLDFLIVSAFNSKSEEFFLTMHSDVQRSSDGLYIVYCNALSDRLNGEGRSALFAFVDDCFKSEFVDRNCTDLDPKNKIYEFSNDKSYCVFEVDLKHKKPYISKNAHSCSNVKVVTEDDAQMEERYKFQKALSTSEEKYLYIDQYYVKPREYDEMLALLEKENVLVITGDPGIGKTYTAIRIMLDYYQKGFHPVWFFGMDKEDRDEQKEHILNFEPHENDVVYLEDPFGRTVFENKEVLKTLFANWVERFRACKAKLIITSRAEVFKQFEKEVLSGDKLEAYQKELNIRKPSYEIKDLQRIASLYIKSYTNWAGIKELNEIVYKGIEMGELISPLMIYNLVKNHSRETNADLLHKAINEAKDRDLVSQFAEEIRTLSFPAKTLLYLVLLSGKKNIAIIRGLFDKVQIRLFEKARFEGSSFAFELNGQEGHRIQRLGEKIPVYRFSHPTYEEALISLSLKDSSCALVTESCLTELLKYDSSISTEIFRRFILRYPDFLAEQMVNVLDVDFEALSESAKLDLTRKMLLSKNAFFEDKAKLLFPIIDLIKLLYGESKLQLFILQLRMLNTRKEELKDVIIEWKRIFTAERIKKLHPAAFLQCYNLLTGIEENLASKIECNFQKTDLVKKFLILPTDEQRKALDEILRNTAYNYLYKDLKKRIPDLNEQVDGKKRKYIKILRKYVLKSERPKGIVYLDEGAMKAAAGMVNIYPIGVVGVEGDFVNGDIVYLASKKSPQRVLSMIEMASSDIRRFMGLHSSEIEEQADTLISTTISKPNFRDYLPRKKGFGLR